MPARTSPTLHPPSPPTIVTSTLRVNRGRCSFPYAKIPCQDVNSLEDGESVKSDCDLCTGMI